MYILVSGGSTTVAKLLDSNPNLGILLCPDAGNKAPARGTIWAADNSAFSGFNEAKFLKMLERIKGRDDCLFVTSPDVVGNHAETLERWHVWSERIREYGLVPAFVVQDGCDLHNVPWQDLGAIFIGGTTRYKLGKEAAQIVHECNRQGIWVHIGRVNTARRIVYAAAVGANSIDGSSFSRFSATHLPWALRLSRNGLLFAVDSAEADA